MQNHYSSPYSRGVKSANEERLKPNYELPFFAYGIFQPGEISFLGIREYVKKCTKDSVKGYLDIWDGITIIDIKGDKNIQGYVIEFKNKQEAEKAYSFINSIEPIELYQWSEEYTDSRKPVNLLIKSQRSHIDFKNNDADDWQTIWHDPFWNLSKNDYTPQESAIKILLNYQTPEFNKYSFAPIFDLQMHYLMLWTIVERFVFFRYGKQESINAGLRKFGNSLCFQEAYEKIATEGKNKWVFSSETGQIRYKYYKQTKQCDILYYHQVRNNVTHRGKAAMASKKDYEIVKFAFNELIQIMKYVLIETKKECDELKKQIEQNNE